MPRKVFFDIETIPAPKELEPQLRELYELKKAQKAQRARRGIETPTSFAGYLRSTSLNGAFGRICCLCYAIDNGSVEGLYGDERDILERFWAQITPDTIFVGHNIFGFDVPFILMRSRILGVKPTLMPSLARYRSNHLYDTMHEWTGWNKNVSLHELSVALGLPTSKGGIDGSQVGAYFAAGKLDEIVEYCKRDVVLTRQVYKKLTFDDTLPQPAYRR